MSILLPDILLCVFLLLIGKVRLQDSACGEGSTCVPLEKCQSLQNELLRNNSRAKRQEVQTLKCGEENSSLKVCCPAISILRGSSLLPRNCGFPADNFRIVNGNNTVIGEYPWIAALFYRNNSKAREQFMCSGTLISSRYILTAAHCLVDIEEQEKLYLTTIRIQEYDLTINPDCVRGHCLPYLGFSPEQQIIHPMYRTRGRTSDDIALIRMNSTLDLEEYAGFVSTICLPPQSISAQFISQGTNVIAIGWGSTGLRGRTNVLLQTKLPFVDPVRCQEVFRSVFHSKQLCIGKGGEDTCMGDSGGPVHLLGPSGPPYLQVGIVSIGSKNCGTTGIPAIYTEVSQYVDWILSQLRE